MACLDLFLHRNGGDLLVVARLHLFLGDGVDDMLLEVGIVQFALGQVGDALLEGRIILQAFLFGSVRKELDVDDRREGGGALLLLRHLLQLRVETAQRQRELGLAHFLAANLGDHRIGVFRARATMNGHRRNQCRGGQGFQLGHAH
ncbi:hypothetical protein D9M70_566800 [compost metagenome]